MPKTANGCEYPVLGDSNNPPAFLQQLGLSVDEAYGRAVSTWSGLAALTDNFPGRQVWITDLGVQATWNGTKWLVGVQHAVKASDQGYTTTTTLDDVDDLEVELPSAGTYIITATLYGRSAADSAGDLRVGATWPTATVNITGRGPDPSLGANTFNTGEWKTSLNANSGSSVISYGLNSAGVSVVVEFEVIASAAGTFQLQAAQVTSSGSASTVKAGSRIRCEQIA